MSIDHEVVERLLHERLSDREDRVSEIALAARRLVHKLSGDSGSDCSELLYCSYCVSDVFSFSGKLGQAYIHIATYAGHVNLGFNHGVDLPDPKQLLQGSGKAIRHVRLNSTTDLKSKPIKALIVAAVGQGIEMAQRKGELPESRFVDKSSG